MSARQLANACGYLALYLALEWVCYARPVLAPGITPWHPQAGITLALLVSLGPEWCPLAALAAFAAQLAVRWPHPSIGALALGACWTALVFAALALLVRRLLPRRKLLTVTDATNFAWAACALTLAGALGYVGVFIASGDLPAEDAVRGVARYWFADMNGVLMLTPLLLLTESDGRATPAWRGRGAEILAQLALVLVILAAIFALPDSEQLRLFYLLFVPVIWIALRWGWAGALTAALLIQAGLIFAAEADLHTPRFIDTQFLMLTLTLTALLVGSVVAERRRTEARLRERDTDLSRAMRFAVAGELASATAHELNQPMTALVSYLNAAEILAGSAAQEEERLRLTLRKAAAEALRASDVLHKLRNFYTGGRARRARVDLAALCHSSVAAFADRLQRSGIVLEVFVDPGLPAIEADETQLHIVLHNLIANGIDAVESRQGAAKRIEVCVQADGERVTIAVEDSGTGIAAAMAQLLFEPFVTSKPDGMGLGLAISRSLVRAAGGELSVASASKLGGARFRVSLPIMSGRSAE